MVIKNEPTCQNNQRCVLVCWRVGVLVCRCVGVLVCWCVGVLVCRCVGVLVCWCVGVFLCGSDYLGGWRASAAGVANSAGGVAKSVEL